MDNTNKSLQSLDENIRKKGNKRNITYAREKISFECVRNGFEQHSGIEPVNLNTKSCII